MSTNHTICRYLILDIWCSSFPFVKYCLSFVTCKCVDDTLWTGNPGNYTNPDAPKVLSEVRKLVDDGKYAEATKAAVDLSGNPSDVSYLVFLNAALMFCFIIKYIQGT